MRDKLKSKKKFFEVKFVSNEKKNEMLSKQNFNLSENSKCIVCDDRITHDNIGIFTEKSGSVIFVCNKPRCLKMNKIMSQE